MKAKKLMKIANALRDAAYALEQEEQDNEVPWCDQIPMKGWKGPVEEAPPRAPEVEGTAGLPAVFMDNPHELYLTLQGRTGKVTHITAHPPTAYPGDCKVVKFIRVDESVYHGTQIEEQEKEQV